MKKILLTTIITLIGIHTTIAQVGIGTETPKTSLQVVGEPASTTTADGVQVPSLSLTELNAKVAAYGTDQNGAIVYIYDVSAITTTSETAGINTVGFYYYDAGSDTWKALGINLTSDNNSILLGGGGTKLVNDFWLNAGNSGSNPATDFLGTTDNQGLSIRTNSLERIRVDDTGNVGIGTSTPANTLDVNGGTNIRGRLNMIDKGDNTNPGYSVLYNNNGFTILRAAASRNQINLQNADLTKIFASFNTNNTVFNSDKLTLNGNVEISGNTTAAGAVTANAFVGDGSGLSNINSTLADGSVTSAKILDGEIVNVDISSSAAIAQSKIDGLITSLAAKADLDSPTFTGTPSLPAGTIGVTQTAEDNTTAVATTEFVATALASVDAAGLVSVTENGNKGFRRADADAANYGDIGSGAVDLSFFNDFPNSTQGATGNNSVAMGNRTIASGQESTAMGISTIASAIRSTAMGGFTTASGNLSTAMGVSTTASGNTSTAMGSNTKALGTSSTAMGNQTTASGQTSFAMGNQTTASDYGSVVLGQFNDAGSAVSSGGSATLFDTDNTAFVIGNGTSTSVKSDAFKVLFNGNTTAAGTVTAKRYELTAPSGISAAATTTLDLSTGNVLTLNLSANITTLTLTNTAVGTYLIKFIQDGTGSKTVAFPSDWLWSGGTVPTVTPTANKTDIVTLIYDGTTYYAAISQNF